MNERGLVIAFDHWLWYLINGTLWLFNIAMENDPFKDDVPI